MCLCIPISTHLNVCVSPRVPISIQQHLHVPISVSMSPFLSLCPHFCLPVPISIHLWGCTALPQNHIWGLSIPPPPKSHGCSPPQHITPTPIPPLPLLCISYGSPIDLDPRLGNIWGFAVGFPAPICIQRSQQPPPPPPRPPSAPHLPPLQPHCSYAGCCDPGAEPAALLCGQNSSPLSPCG